MKYINICLLSDEIKTKQWEIVSILIKTLLMIIHYSKIIEGKTTLLKLLLRCFSRHSVLDENYKKIKYIWTRHWFLIEVK